ncbi:unnamed protein product [Parnassius apollo]|uniref:(apollo) hypothetical protein n=1 Tax=Parnassius apollo TaxID=110799 RepID=A0A8S3WZ94_PARAO|nr:unnamed protein product [Parnassius apollo]
MSFACGGGAVVAELEGLRRSARAGVAAGAARDWLAAARGVRLATARGSLLASRAFTAERDRPRACNDDRVLATALALHANLANPADTRADNQDESGESSKCVRQVCEVVLLTDDRNLRVKALAAELPTRDLPSFVQWAGISCDETASTESQPSAGCNSTSGDN